MEVRGGQCIKREENHPAPWEVLWRSLSSWVQARLGWNYLGTDNGIGVRRHADGIPQSKARRALSGALEVSVLLNAEGFDLWNQSPRARRRGRLNDGSGGIFFKHEVPAADAMPSSGNALLSHSKPPNSCT